MSYLLGNDRGKNQYQNLSDARNQTSLRSVLGWMMVGFCMTFLTLSAWNFNNSTSTTIGLHVFHLSSKQSVLRTTSEKFLSFGLDSSLLRDMKSLPVTNERFVNLARHLSPAFVRIGGTSADCLFFEKIVEGTSKKITSPVDGQDISNFTITSTDFQNIYDFTVKAQLRMIFDLNVLIRNSDGWDSSNARDIISFARDHDMDLDWQLGNEPNSFHHVFNVTVNATQLGKDYGRLRQLLNQAGYDKSILVGPEVNHVGDSDHMGEIYASIFLTSDSDSVDYVTWHQYYLNGRIARIQDFLDPKTFNYLPMQIMVMQQAVKSTHKNLSTWLSETSTAYGGGAPELSDRFVAGFLWLDKLGYSASAGVNVVTRQSLYGGNYAMVDADLSPNPDWWVSVAYKQFVSEKVLKLTSPNNFGHVRLYAHCTPEKTLFNRVPAITIYGMNLNKHPSRVLIEGILPFLHKNARIFLYTLTADNLQSRDIRMNGEVLKLEADGSLPPFRAVVLDPTQPVTLPAYSMVFLVIHGAEIPACSA